MPPQSHPHPSRFCHRLTPPKLPCLKLLRVLRSNRCKQPRPIPREELAAVAATEAAEAAKRSAVADSVSPSQLAEERVLGTLLQLARDIRRPRHYIGYSAFMCFCLSRACRAYFWEGGGKMITQSEERFSEIPKLLISLG